MIYRQRRLPFAQRQQSHKRVSLRLHDRFSQFSESWLKEHASKTMVKQIEDWLVGNSRDGQKLCRTHVSQVKAEETTPYHPFRRFSVAYPLPTTTSSSATLSSVATSSSSSSSQGHSLGQQQQQQHPRSQLLSSAPSSHGSYALTGSGKTTS